MPVFRRHELVGCRARFVYPGWGAEIGAPEGGRLPIQIKTLPTVFSGKGAVYSGNVEIPVLEKPIATISRSANGSAAPG